MTRPSNLGPRASSRAPGRARSADDTTRRFRKLLAADWKAALAEHPELATQTGAKDHGGCWTDLSFEAIEQRKRRQRRVMKSLQSLDARLLPPADRLDHELFSRQLQENLDGNRFPGELLALDQTGGVPASVPQVLAMMPAFTVGDFEDMLSRMAAVPTLVDQTIALMQEGLRRGVTPPRLLMGQVPKQLRCQIRKRPEDSEMFDAFRSFPSTVPEAGHKALRRRAVEALAKRVFPAFERLAKYTEKQYTPRTREATAWTALPDGEAWYAHRVREQITIDVPPRELHDLGLREVARLRAAMDALIRETEFDGDFAAFCDFLRTDPRFFFTDGDAMLDAYRSVLKRIEPRVVALFTRLPRLPCGVRPVPEPMQSTSGTAYYQAGSLAGGRPGWFYANPYNLKARPRWEMEALTLHEAVPGHHFQLALAQEQEEVAPFRKWGHYGAFVEGWALYSETLGYELGLYQDPYSRMGQLSYEVFRACRLVIDTGLHAFGWSRNRAIAYFLENSCTTRHDAEVEVDYYLGAPGQALTYKVGERVFRRLREQAVARLGARFDLRTFHDQLLADGPLPLDVLERRLGAWLEARARAGKRRAAVKLEGGLRLEA
jgi:uncharacterized protein (DUF885 family)